MTSKRDDSFERIRRLAADPDIAPPRLPAGGGEHLTPVPDDAPALPAEWHGLGKPVAAWPYRDAAGRLLRWTLRFLKANGEKDIRPATLWRDGVGKPFRWRTKAEPGLRPLYGLDRLAARPAALVLMVEGEKAADAATKHFPTLVAVTWPGGANAIGKADWSPLAGRQVVVWPDADDAGRKAAQAAARAALAAGADLAATVDLPSGLPPAWDLADAWPLGLDPKRAAELVEAARAHPISRQAQPAAPLSPPPGETEWPPGLRMDAQAGLFWDEQKDGVPIPHWISDPFEVLGEARTADGLGWSVVVQFRDRDRRQRIVPIPRAGLASGGGDARALLADAGLSFRTGLGFLGKLSEGLMRVKSAARITLVGATGWSGERFVLPGRTFGPPGGEPVLFTGEAPSLNYGVSGHGDVWKAQVAALAVGNSALTFAIAAAFAAPLLRVLEGEGGGFHFRGNSSTGKSTLLVAAGSVWGGSKGEQGFGHTWRATANALENLALAHNDTLLCLDEFAQVDPSEAGSAAYTLANGQGKARSRSDGSLRRRAEWLLLFLSSGEVSLGDHMAASAKGGRTAVGQELRLVDVPAEAGSGMGIWETLHGAIGPAALSESVKAAAKSHYGHAGPMFLERLTAEREVAVAHAREIVKAFLSQAEREGDSGQVRRVGRRFGLIGAAGELAISWGVVPWPAGSAVQASLALYRRWAEGFGRDAPREERAVLEALRNVIEAERSAFAPLGDDHASEEALPSPGGRDAEARQLKTLGYRRVRATEVQYLFHNEGWRHAFRGFDLQEAARIVHRAGFLEPDHDKKRLKKKVRIRGESHWVYCVKSEILEANFGD